MNKEKAGERWRVMKIVRAGADIGNDLSSEAGVKLLAAEHALGLAENSVVRHLSGAAYLGGNLMQVKSEGGFWVLPWSACGAPGERAA